MNADGRVWTHPLIESGKILGFYATALRIDGWKVERFGETEELAKANLLEYISSGQFDRDRGR